MYASFPINRSISLALLTLLAACATGGPDSRRLAIDTRSGGKAVPGANCVVHLGPQTFNVTTPVVLPVGEAIGDLQVTCNKAGYRTSELYFRATATGGSSLGIGAGGGGGHVGVGLGMSFPLGGPGRSDYPPQVTLELTPQ